MFNVLRNEFLFKFDTDGRESYDYVFVCEAEDRDLVLCVTINKYYTHTFYKLKKAI